MEALGINLGYLLSQILLFVILLLVLRHYAYDPILNALEDRRERIAKGLEDARQAAIARDNADEEAKKILDGARADAAKLRQDAVAQAEEAAKGIEADANSRAREIIANAEQDAERIRNEALAELRGQVAAISMAAANKLVGEALDEKRQRALLKDFFAKVPEGVSGLSGDTAVVTSSLPLTDAEKGNIQKTLKTDNVTFKVDPRILGGLVIRVGDQVVDTSVAGRMEEMAESLR